MKILVTSYAFHPSVGGLEEASLLLAEEFVAQGHEVTVVTATSANDPDGFPFPVVRNPSPLRLIKLPRWADLVFQNNLSLQFAWPVLLTRRPWVIAHQTWLTASDGRTGWRQRFKQLVTRT